MDRKNFAGGSSELEWFKAQTPAVRCKVTSRAAIRSLPNYRGKLGDGPDDSDLALLRVCLVAATQGFGLPSNLDWVGLGQAATFNLRGVSKIQRSRWSHDVRETTFSFHSADKVIDAVRHSVSTSSLASDATVTTECSARSASLASVEGESLLLDDDLREKFEGAEKISNSATNWDAKNIEFLADAPAWNTEKIPTAVLENYRNYLVLLRSHRSWFFWSRFFKGMWNGTFTEWDLAFEVIQIEEGIWEAGVEAVAAEIAKIEARLKPDLLPDAEAVGLAQKIVTKPETAILAADGLAQLIEMATQEYKREVSNALPEELEPLDSLPAILNDLSLILTSSKPNTDKEAQLQAALKLTASTVFDLNRRLKAAATELESLRRNGKGRRLFADAFYEKAGERTAELITSKVLWAGLMAGAGFLLGGSSAEALTNGVQECFQGIIQPEANEAVKPSIKPK